MKKFNIKEWQEKYLINESGWNSRGEHNDIDGHESVMTHPTFVKAFRAAKKKSPSFSFSDEKSGNKVINKASRAFDRSHNKATFAIGTNPNAPTYNPKEAEKLAKDTAEKYAVLYHAINHAMDKYGYKPYGGSDRHKKRFDV